MPVLKPSIQNLMDQTFNPKSKSKDIKDQLDCAGLSLEETLASMRQIRDFSESESTKVRINESVLKMHGAMTDAAALAIPSINIIIEDSNKEGANNIFLPRELHKTNESKKEVIQ